FNGSCINRMNSNNNTLCGQGGITCVTCGTNQTCQNYVCTGSTTGGGGGTTGGGGGTTGGIGMPCTSTAQCAGLGSGAYCKTQTTPWPGTPPTPYPNGFCTFPCPTGVCPSGGTCAGGTSSWPYLFNETDRFCAQTCTSTCGTGFSCLQVDALSAASNNRGCILTPATANFTGGGNPTKAGNACVTDTDCANPPDPVLAQCLDTADFPQGYCLADSNFAPPDTWCAGANKVEVGFPLPDGGTNYFCIGTCTSPGNPSSARTGYTCYQKSANEPSIGILWPKCTAADCTGTYPACNPTSGFCCDTSTGTNCGYNFL
ncbi:MAG TPA: hypothetical protein VGE37_07330, partial [Archangium sp.]